MVGASVTRIIDSNWSRQARLDLPQMCQRRGHVVDGGTGERLEARHADRIGIERRLAPVQSGQHLDHPQQRVVADPRHRRVACATVR